MEGCSISNIKSLTVSGHVVLLFFVSVGILENGEQENQSAAIDGTIRFLEEFSGIIRRSLGFPVQPPLFGPTFKLVLHEEG